MSESAPSPGSSRLDQVLSGDMPWWAISLRGMAMGAADVVPGVSGGTMALILGVYTRFIDALRSLNGALLKEVLVFLKAGLGAEARPRFWAAVRGADTFFLAFLGAGVVTAIASFSKVIPWLIDHYPAHMNGLFFGMIAASTMVPFRMMERRGAVQLVAFVLATAFAFWFSGLPVLNVEASLPFLFVCGAIAICAMMLPGVSGSFLLLVLGQYTYVLTALKNQLRRSFGSRFAAEGLAVQGHERPDRRRQEGRLGRRQRAAHRRLVHRRGRAAPRADGRRPDRGGGAREGRRRQGQAGPLAHRRSPADGRPWTVRRRAARRAHRTFTSMRPTNWCRPLLFVDP